MADKTAQRENSFGIALAYLLVGVSGGIGLDLCAKQLLLTYSVEQFVFLRSVFGMLFFFLCARWYGGFGALRSQRWGWHFLRTLFAVGAMFGFFYGLTKMPLVNALTIAFTAPIIVTALSVPVLGEHVGWRRWLAVLIGFAGVLVILRPGESSANLAVISVLIAAFCWAGLILTARQLATTETSFSLSFYLVIGPLIAAAFVLPGDYLAPSGNAWFLFILSGLCSVIAWVGIVGGYRRAPPVILAPFEYTGLVMGAIAGYLLWDEIPDRWVIIGAIIIIGSGLFIASREVDQATLNNYLRKLSRKRS